MLCKFLCSPSLSSKLLLLFFFFFFFPTALNGTFLHHENDCFCVSSIWKTGSIWHLWYIKWIVSSSDIAFWGWGKKRKAPHIFLFTVRYSLCSYKNLCLQTSRFVSPAAKNIFLSANISYLLFTHCNYVFTQNWTHQ